MTSREQFEAWVLARGLTLDAMAISLSPFEVWQAARAQALEEAAKACDDLKTSHANDANEAIDDPACDFQAAWKLAAHAIRSMAKE